MLVGLGVGVFWGLVTVVLSIALVSAPFRYKRFLKKEIREKRKLEYGQWNNM